MITLPAPTAATGIASPKAHRRTACSPNCLEKKQATAAAKADRCTSPIPQPVILAQTQLLVAASASPPAPLSPQKLSVRTGWQSAASGTGLAGRDRSTK